MGLFGWAMVPRSEAAPVAWDARRESARQRDDSGVLISTFTSSTARDTSEQPAELEARDRRGAGLGLYTTRKWEMYWEPRRSQEEVSRRRRA